MESTGGNDGGAGEGVVGGEDGRARAELLELAGTGDHVREGEGVGVVEGEDAVVGDFAGDGTGDAAVAELEGAGGNGGDAGIGVVRDEEGGAGTELEELSGAGDGVGKRESVGVVDGEEGSVEDNAAAEGAGGARRFQAGGCRR